MNKIQILLNILLIFNSIESKFNRIRLPLISGSDSLRNVDLLDNTGYQFEEEEQELSQEEEDIGTTRETKVEVKQNYLDCVNINSEIEKMSTNFSVISGENCNTIYRFPVFQMVYDVLLKNGTSTQLVIQLYLQNNEILSDKTVVTLTGKVVDGYLSGALFQNVIVYPPITDPNICSTEPGVESLRSTSVSVTMIFLPSKPVSELDFLSAPVVRLPEAFDCFGDSSVDYTPGLIFL